MNEPAPKVPSIAIELDDDDAQTRIYRPESRVEGEAKSGVHPSPSGQSGLMRPSRQPSPSHLAPPRPGVVRQKVRAPSKKLPHSGARTESAISARPTAPPPAESAAVRQPSLSFSDETKVFRPPPDLIQAASRRKEEKAREAKRARLAQIDDQATQLRQVPKELIYEARRTRARTLGRKVRDLPTGGPASPASHEAAVPQSAEAATDSSPPNLATPEQMDAERAEITKASQRKLDPSFDAQTIYVSSDLAGSRSSWAKALLLSLVLLLSIGAFAAFQFGLGSGLFG